MIAGLCFGLFFGQVLPAHATDSAASLQTSGYRPHLLASPSNLSDSDEEPGEDPGEDLADADEDTVLLFDLAPATPSNGSPVEVPERIIASVERWYPLTCAFAVVQDSDLDFLATELDDWGFQLRASDEGGGSSHISLPISWDLSGIDTSKTGVYTAVGGLILPEGYRLSDAFTAPDISIPVSVQAEGMPDINCCYSGRGSLCFPWVTPPGSSKDWKVWLTKDGGEWIQVAEYEGVKLNERELTLYTRVLESGSTYRVQVDYPGGSTGILEFLFDDTIMITNYSGGDRDGNDSDDDSVDPPFMQPIPPINTLVPDPNTGNQDESTSGNGGSTSGNNGSSSGSAPTDTDSKPSVPSESRPADDSSASDALSAEFPASDAPASGTPEIRIPADGTPSTIQKDSSPVATLTQESAVSAWEHVDRDTMTLSGARISWLLKNQAEVVPLGWNEVSLSLPAEFLLGLKLAPEELLSITITRPDELAFTISMTADGTALTSIGETMVRIPLTGSSGGYVLMQGDTPLDTMITIEDSCAVFSIHETGSYRLAEALSPPQSGFGTESAPSPKRPGQVIPIGKGTGLAIGMLLAILGFALWRKRR